MSIPLTFRLWFAGLVLLIGAVVDQAGGEPKPLPMAAARPSVDAFGDPLPDGALARLGTMRFRQGNTIHTVAISPDGKVIASAGYPRTIHLWDAATGRRLHRLEGSESWIYSLTFLPDNKTLVSAGDAQAIHFWDVATGKLKRRLANPCSYVAIAPDGKTMASADHRSVIRILDVASGKQLHQLQALKGEIYSLAFSPDGATLAWGGGDDGKRIHLHLADVKTGKELRRCQADGRHIRSLAFSPDGTTLASAGNQQPIRLWEVATGKEMRQYGEREAFLGAVLFSPDGKNLISGHQNGSIAVWELATGKELRRWTADASSISTLALAGDGHTLIAGGHAGLIRLWDLRTGKELGLVAGKQTVINHWAFAADGKTLVSLCLDGAVRHWDTATGCELRHLPGPRGFVRASFAPGGRALATLAEDGIIKVRQTANGKESWRLSEGKDTYHGLCFSPDGNILVTGLWGTKLRLLDAATGRERGQMADGERYFQNAAFSPDGKLLTTSHLESELSDVLSSEIRIPIVDRIRFWNVSTGKKLQAIEGKWDRALRLSISPDGKMLALASTDGVVALWELATKKERWRSPAPDPKGSADRLQLFTFSPDGALMLVGDGGNRLTPRETLTGKARAQVMVHDGPVHDAGFSADGKTLAALGADGTIMLWDAARLSRRPAVAARKLSAAELDSLWVDLAADDAPRAWKAIATLASAREPAIAWLNERLAPAPAPDVQKIKRLLSDLGSNDFQQRAKATRDLETRGDVAEPALRESLQANPPLEPRRRIEALLARLESKIIAGNMLRELRALETFEYIGTPEACQVLSRLSKGAPAALLTREAQASLQRLAKRTITSP